jgi:hypothetical protein
VTSRPTVHHDQKPRVAHQRLGNAEHLALAAGQAAGRQPPALGQRRENGVEFVDPPARSVRRQELRTDQDIFFDGQTRKA